MVFDAKKLGVLGRGQKIYTFFCRVRRVDTDVEVGIGGVELWVGGWELKVKNLHILGEGEES